MNDGDLNLIAATRYYSTSENFDTEGNKQKIPNFSKSEINPYVEYGLDNDTTIGGAFSVEQIANQSSEKQSEAGLKFLDIFFRKYLVKQDSWVLSIEPGLRKPFEIGSEISSDGSNMIPSLRLNYGYGAENWYAESSIGVFKRTAKGANDMIKFEAKINRHVAEDISLQLDLFRDETLGGERDNPLLNYDMTKAKISAWWEQTEKKSHQIGFYMPLDGCNAGAGYGLVYTYMYKF